MDFLWYINDLKKKKCSFCGVEGKHPKNQYVRIWREKKIKEMKENLEKMKILRKIIMKNFKIAYICNKNLLLNIFFMTD
jgi:hypothetical protein